MLVAANAIPDAAAAERHREPLGAFGPGLDHRRRASLRRELRARVRAVRTREASRAATRHGHVQPQRPRRTSVVAQAQTNDDARVRVRTGRLGGGFFFSLGGEKKHARHHRGASADSRRGDPPDRARRARLVFPGRAVPRSPTSRPHRGSARAATPGRPRPAPPSSWAASPAEALASAWRQRLAEATFVSPFAPQHATDAARVSLSPASALTSTETPCVACDAASIAPTHATAPSGRRSSPGAPARPPRRRRRQAPTTSSRPRFPSAATRRPSGAAAVSRRSGVRGRVLLVPDAEVQMKRVAHTKNSAGSRCVVGAPGAREHERPDQATFRRLFLLSRRRPSRTPPRSHPPGRPHRGSRGLAFGPGRDPRAASARAGRPRASTARRRSRLGACVSRRLRSWPTFARATPTHRRSTGSTPRSPRRATTRSASRSTPPRGSRRRTSARTASRDRSGGLPQARVRADAGRASCMTRSLRTTRRNGESIAATVDGKKRHAREAAAAREGGRRVAERRHSCYFTALFTLMVQQRPSTATLAWRFRSRPESEHLPRPRRAGSRPRVGRKMRRRCE